MDRRVRFMAFVVSDADVMEEDEIPRHNGLFWKVFLFAFRVFVGHWSWF
jgi:hypothetical protein